MNSKKKYCKSFLDYLYLATIYKQLVKFNKNKYNKESAEVE